MRAACAAGGVGLPDIVTVENREAGIFWAQFPDRFADLRGLGYDEAMEARFPEFKRVELEMGGRVHAMSWDSGPVMMVYRRDLCEAAGVDPEGIETQGSRMTGWICSSTPWTPRLQAGPRTRPTCAPIASRTRAQNQAPTRQPWVETWDDFIEAGRALAEANPGVVMAEANINGDTEFFLMIGNEHGCRCFSDDASAITVASEACAETLGAIKAMHDAGVLAGANRGEKIQSMVGGTAATRMCGGWYEGTVRTSVPEDRSGAWGVYRMPSVDGEGPRAANFGGSALAIAANSDNPEAAFAFLAFALGTPEGQVTMLREHGLVPSLLEALEDGCVREAQDFRGGQEIWVATLDTLGDIVPSRGTPFYGDEVGVMTAVQLRCLQGGYGSAQAAVDDAARQIALAMGLRSCAIVREPRVFLFDEPLSNSTPSRACRCASRSPSSMPSRARP